MVPKPKVSTPPKKHPKFNLTSLTVEGYYAWVFEEMCRLDDCDMQETLKHVLREWVSNGEHLGGYGGLTRADYANRDKVKQHPSSKK